MHRWGLFAIALSVASCGGFQLLPNGDGSAGDRDLSFPPGTDLAGFDFSTSGNVDFAQQGGGTGPGPYGAMPTGYCCNSSDDCRERSCVDFGGGKMCSDGCFEDSACDASPGITASAPPRTTRSLSAGRQRRPLHPGVELPLWRKELGACCIATHDGHAGAECEGGRCDASGDLSNPYICTNVCKGPTDCPGNFNCFNIGPFSVCAPIPIPAPATSNARGICSAWYCAGDPSTKIVGTTSTAVRRKQRRFGVVERFADGCFWSLSRDAHWHEHLRWRRLARRSSGESATGNSGQRPANPIGGDRCVAGGSVGARRQLEEAEVVLRCAHRADLGRALLGMVRIGDHSTEAHAVAGAQPERRAVGFASPFQPGARRPLFEEQLELLVSDADPGSIPSSSPLGFCTVTVPQQKSPGRSARRTPGRRRAPGERRRSRRGCR